MIHEHHPPTTTKTLTTLIQQSHIHPNTNKHYILKLNTLQMLNMKIH